MKSLPQHLGTRKRFELVRKLGEGGMGSVYEALDRERNERFRARGVTRPEHVIAALAPLAVR